MPEPVTELGGWIASPGSWYKHIAHPKDRRTLCGIRFALMTQRHVRRQPECPECNQHLADAARWLETEAGNHGNNRS